MCAVSGWGGIKTLPSNCHDPVFLNILNDFGFGNIAIPVPLKKRYTKGRKWTAWEIDELKRLWVNGHNLTFISAVLNRNPQDIIYKFIRGEKLFEDFSQKGRSEGSSNWTSTVEKCAHALFAEGLPASAAFTTRSLAGGGGSGSQRTTRALVLLHSRTSGMRDTRIHTRHNSC